MNSLISHILILHAYATRHRPFRKMVVKEPISKKRDKKVQGNYRFMGLTSVVGELLKSIIKDKILSYLESN